MNQTEPNNRYVQLIHTNPDYIFASKSSLLDSVEELRLKSLLNSQKKVFCEIGSGSGGHLIELAGAQPDSFFLGLELRFKRAFRTAEKAQQLGLKNLAVARHDAKKIESLFSTGTVDGFYINFPDPWSDKRRWNKHRLIKPDYLKALHTMLRKDGFISYKTDHHLNFLEAQKFIEEGKIFKISRYSTDLISSEFNDKNVTTEFERLFISKGCPIYYMQLEKH